ncbi:MAG: helix-turn-helix transcriptional regulator [Thermoleophilaceae bacterium]|nr:helix-turn-helix transcriptional regulator [Thermoleophilaceae bacterium]
MTNTKTGVDQRLVRAIGHPLRLRLLTIFNERVASPSDLAAELGEPIGNVSYHTRILARLGCVELVKTKQVRGAVEHYYRAVVRPIFSDDDWAELPPSIRKSLAGAVLTEIADDMGAAANEGGFDRDDVHLSRTPLVLDQRGWQELNDRLQEIGEQALEIQAQSAARLQAEGARDSEAAALVLMLFEPPTAQGKTDDRKAKRERSKKKK